MARPWSFGFLVAEREYWARGVIVANRFVRARVDYIAIAIQG
jgi:hypothetical protein